MKAASTMVPHIGNKLNNHMRRHRHYHSALARYIDANCTRCPAHRIAELEKDVQHLTKEHATLQWALETQRQK